MKFDDVLDLEKDKNKQIYQESFCSIASERFKNFEDERYGLIVLPVLRKCNLITQIESGNIHSNDEQFENTVVSDVNDYT